MSTEIETRIGFSGDCFRCGEYGHWHGSPECGWTVKAASDEEHERRIDSLIERWQQHLISLSLKRLYITAEIELCR